MITKEIRALAELSSAKLLSSDNKLHTFEVLNAHGNTHEVDIKINCNCTNCVQYGGMGKICHTTLAALLCIVNSESLSKPHSNRLLNLADKDQQIIDLALNNMRDCGCITQRDVVDLNRRIIVAMIKKKEHEEENK
jgi:hypothetical protein